MRVKSNFFYLICNLNVEKDSCFISNIFYGIKSNKIAKITREYLLKQHQIRITKKNISNFVNYDGTSDLIEYLMESKNKNLIIKKGSVVNCDPIIDIIASMYNNVRVEFDFNYVCKIDSVALDHITKLSGLMGIEGFGTLIDDINRSLKHTDGIWLISDYGDWRC